MLTARRPSFTLTPLVLSRPSPSPLWCSLAQVVSGLAYLHSQGVCHRDIKLANLLRSTKSSNFQMKIADFGAACVFAVPEDCAYVGSPAEAGGSPDHDSFKVPRTFPSVPSAQRSVPVLSSLLLASPHPSLFLGMHDRQSTRAGSASARLATWRPKCSIVRGFARAHTPPTQR